MIKIINGTLIMLLVTIIIFGIGFVYKVNNGLDPTSSLDMMYAKLILYMNNEPTTDLNAVLLCIGSNF